MKKILKYTAIAAVTLGMSACNDDFLQKEPTSTISEATVFESYQSAQAYAWQFYDMLYNTTIGTSANSHGYNSIYNADRNAGYFSQRTGSGNSYAFQTLTDAASGNGWNFSYIYRINIMLRGLETSSMPENEVNHWKAVCYFFHSFWYMELIDRFGDVPWIDKVLDPETEDGFMERTSRDVVAQNIMNNLKWAELNIGNFTDRDGNNSITKAAVQMALSRFTLREGTWRKYHGLTGADTYLEECARVSKAVMDAYPTLHTGTDGQPGAGYGEMWTSPDLGTVPGVILYREYVSGLAVTAFNFRERNDQAVYQLSQDMVDLYLTKNGLPIHNAENTQYEGDSHDIYDVFRNRDPRLYHTVTPPYKIIKNAGASHPNLPEGSKGQWAYDTSDPKYREYIDLMGADVTPSNPGKAGAMKRLPISNWNAGNIIPSSPNLRGMGTAPCSTNSGYYLWKNYCCWDLCNNNAATSEGDKPIFKVEEAILNYAEAMCELGDFDQTAADISINRLRARVGVAKLVVDDVDADYDPNRDKGNNPHWTGDKPDYAVDPLLWEVRRERIIELMGEGFGFYDVRRWAKAPYFINRQEKGMYAYAAETADYKVVQNSNETGLLNLTSTLKDNTLTEGYLYIQADPLTQGKGWLDKYYLYCVPTEEIILNPNLSQNPGWLDPNANAGSNE